MAGEPETVTIILDRRTAENTYYALALALGAVGPLGELGKKGKGKGKGKPTGRIPPNGKGPKQQYTRKP